MKALVYLLLILLLSPVSLGICQGEVWFEGSNPKEPQELRLNMQSIDNASGSLPVCFLYLNETQPKLVNLTITVGTMALFYQTGNFETCLSIDSQEPQKLFGLYHEQGSAAGEMYRRTYNASLSGLETGSHLVKLRVAGEYYGPDFGPGAKSGNYDCEGNTTIVISGQTQTSPTPIILTEPLLNTITIILVVLLIGVSIGLLLYKLRTRPKKQKTFD
jgi:hypothetical protein